MVQMIPNAAIIAGTVTGIETYQEQEGFYIVTLKITEAGEKEGMKFLGNGLVNKEAKILIDAGLQDKLHLQNNISVTGEIKKVTPKLWRAIEDTWQLPGSEMTSANRSVKK